MRIIHRLPIRGWAEGDAGGKVGSGFLHPLTDVENHFLEDIDFMEKERALSQKDAAQKFALTRGVLLAGASEISRVDGNRFGNRAEVLCVLAEGVEEAFDRPCQSGAKRRNCEN